ncbi:DUF4192 domain-containing protein [Streptomyces sp. NPDC093252]|uniref:DUF4192 domain-containing protein n=1 Tax=Streptomyces sp. NPDC093252 TaxID=3154980 RepID=UPI003445C5AA
MTNHGESTGPSDNHDVNNPTKPAKGGDGPQGIGDDISAYVGHGGAQQVTLRSPGELADALPYLLGYRPEDSIVLVSLYDKNGRGRLGGRARLGIPANPDDWPSVAKQLAHGLVTAGLRRGTPPEQMVVYVCQEPAPGETGQSVMDRLRPLAQHLRLECGLLDVPVIEALCISGGRYWSYCCSQPDCCPPDGAAMGLPGTSVLAAAATYAGLQVRGTLRELRARLLPMETAAALEQETALDKAGVSLVPRILDGASRAAVAAETVELAAHVMHRFADAPKVPGTLPSDLRDDTLLTDNEAAALILGLQDRTTRDRAAEWMEGEAAAPALRLWRALARRCVGSYTEHAAAPLTLAGWVAWSTGDDLEAREALAMALGADTEYLFARLLHQAVNEGLDPESIRRCLRSERTGREERKSSVGLETPVGSEGPEGVEDSGPGLEEDGEPGLEGHSGSSPEASGVSESSMPFAPASDDASEVPLSPPSVESGALTPPRRRRPLRPTGAGAGTGPSGARDTRPGARRTSSAPDRIRTAATRTLRANPRDAACDPHQGARFPADGTRPGGGSTDAEE